MNTENFKKADELQRMKDLFWLTYEDLSDSERYNGRSKIVAMEHEVNPDNGGFYTNMVKECASFSKITPNKFFEICDKLSFETKWLDIIKSRNCGMTGIILNYLSWLINNTNPKNGGKVVFLSPYSKMSDIAMKRFLNSSECAVPEHPEDYDVFLLESGYKVTNGKWTVLFTNDKTQVYKIGEPEPEMIIMDEYTCNSNFYKIVMEILMYRRKTRVINIFTPKNDELNENNDIPANKVHTVSIPWYNNIDMIGGLRFTTETDGVKNTINIAKGYGTDIDDNMVKKMKKDGWTITSDYVENFKSCNNDFNNTDNSEKSISDLNRFGELFDLLENSYAYDDEPETEKEVTEDKPEEDPYKNFLKDVFEL